ncbi:hypothetical protein [Vulcanisaeta distributa]|uniref:Uncharacterized protein n=1 Tax=Vulcanisaeta distributa (strain DSM 14429 / JCM 11212 / NBRC 100878 / IC-017) TaxID=572478 RepID=E1QQB4_VULDI|nr:hypothetical protein [Vulcanisaeta distributa]ADN51601.1 hypothetical protein Vdis_2233 [Vulcanisaeta distributa DSM 14429]
MRSLVFLVAGIALLVIMGVSILHAQGISSSAGVNGNVSATGLVTSYYVHLIIAERWVEALNASGINSTAVVELINEAKYYANTGNYLEAIVTLNNAVNLAAQLMSARTNSTQTVINNYVSLTSAVNSTVINNLLSNETIANFTLRALSALSRSSNASYLVKMGVAILSSEERYLYPYVPPNALLGLNTAINVLNMAYNELMSAGLNSTIKQLSIIKTEIITISLLTPPSVRARMIPQVVMPYVVLLSENVSGTLNQLSILLNTTMPMPQQLTQCVGEVNETLVPLINGSLSEPEVYARANEFVNNYVTCLGQVRILINEANATRVVITRFINITRVLNGFGLSNLTPYILNQYLQCRSELINAFNNGNTTLIGQVLSQCESRVQGYEGEAYYAVWVMNLTRNYLTYVNSTIWGLARQHGISGATPMLCYVRLNSDIMGNITSILRAMLNGTITPMEAQALINEYLKNVINSTPSLAAGCLGITTAPHIYVPMGNWATAGPSVSGELSMGYNGNAELIINITNPTQESLYISGFSIGRLTCTFSNNIEVNADSQGTLKLGLSISDGVITGTSSLSGLGGVEVSQGTTVSCTGRSVIMYMPALSGRLYLSNGLWIPFFIMINGGTNTMINYGW